MKSKSYQDYLIESLKDPEEAVAYLQATLEEKDEQVFKLAVFNIAAAFGCQCQKTLELSRKPFGIDTGNRGV